MFLKKVQIFVVLMIVLLSSVSILDSALKNSSTTNVIQQDPIIVRPPSGSFAFLSEFASGGTYSNYGWSLIDNGSAPPIMSSPSYFGEPSLNVTNGTALFSDRNITKGDRSVSFQFAINARDGSGSFTVTNVSGREIATVYVWGNNVSVRAADENASVNGTAPVTPNDAGWILITGNLFNVSSGNGSGWKLEVFVDRTISVFANISAPVGYSYSGLEISCVRGSVFFTDIIFSSYNMAVFLPGYNNMEGYGQGSGFLVNLLKPFTILHADFVLYNWSVVRYSTLSFQINAMNLIAAENQTAKGFFQLGVDLDPNGKIAPWYVGGNNAIAVYFKNYISPDFMPGFNTPSGTVLGLTIQYLPLEKMIFFQIVDYNKTGDTRFCNASVSYSGPEFYAAYTQLETTSMGESQLNGYRFNGTVFDITHGSDFSNMTSFNSSYMLPFSIDTPVTWSLTYYNNYVSGYNQAD